MNVKPFRALRPRADLASRIASLPYDVLDSSEARALAQGDPDTFLHVVKSEIDLPSDIDPHDPRVYAKARENFDMMRREGRLVRDDRPAFYVYRLTMGAHVQTGLVGAVLVDDYVEGRVRKHEHTRPDKEDDRTRHADAIGAHPGPVFLAYRDRGDIDALVAKATARPAAVDFIAADGVAHALWVVDDTGETRDLAGAFAGVPFSYIADGHHRAAAYARVAALRRERSGPARDERPFDRFLAVHFPASQLRILDYNRLVRDLNGLSPAEVVRRIEAAGFDVIEPWEARTPEAPKRFSMYLGGRWRLVASNSIATETDPVAALDVAILQERILSPIFGIGDPRTDQRIAFSGGIRGLSELSRRVDSGEFSVAFAMHPTQLADVMRVADASRVMPPKSTWFEPKLRSGLVIHLLDD